MNSKTTFESGQVVRLQSQPDKCDAVIDINESGPVVKSLNASHEGRNAMLNDRLKSATEEKILRSGNKNATKRNGVPIDFITCVTTIDISKSLFRIKFR